MQEQLRILADAVRAVRSLNSYKCEAGHSTWCPHREGPCGHADCKALELETERDIAYDRALEVLKELDG